MLRLLNLLVCPACHAALQNDDIAKTLNCTVCARMYPVRDGIPVLLVEEAEVDRRKAATVVGVDSLIPRATPRVQPPPFTATYFPWSVILNPDTLKRALLYFDKVYLLGPPAAALDGFLEILENPPPSHRSPVLPTGERQAMIDFFKSIKPLREAGVVEFLDTNEVLSSEAMEREIVRQCFEDIVCDYALPGRTAQLLDSYLPSRSRAVMMHAIGRSNHGALEVQYWESAKVASLYEPIARQVREYLQGIPEKARHFLETQIQLPGATVRALLLNTSLLAIHRAGSVPLTDSHDDLMYLSNKYRRMFDESYHDGAASNTETIRRHVQRLDTRSGLLSVMALEVLVPNIECSSFQDVLEVREHFQDHLQTFRLKMMSLSANLKTTVADPEFERECQDLIATKITPDLLDLQKKVRMSRLKVLQKVLNKTISLKPTVPFVVSVFAPLPLYAAALVSAGIISLETALETYLEKQELLHNNGLAYLLDVNKGELRLDSKLWNRSSTLP